MGKRSKGCSGFGGGGLDREDFLLWKAFTRDVDPLEGTDWDIAEEEAFAAAQQPPKHKTSDGFLPSHAAAEKNPPSLQLDTAVHPVQLDARTEARLRRGKMPVEGRLDLHGCTQEQAHRKLNEFVLDAYKNGKRCVLVITGKGSSRRDGHEYAPGILKQKLPLWISMAPLRAVVLKSFPAVQRDGGGGAWYLYLKRQRDY